MLNKYKLGRIQAGNLILGPFEGMYLFLKGKISAENTSLNRLDRLMEKLGIVGHFLDAFIVYNILKGKGFYVKMESGALLYRRNPREDYRGPVRVIRESGDIEFREMVENGECIYTALDDDNDVTVFVSELWDGTGKNRFSIEGEHDISQFDSVYMTAASGIPDWYGTSLGDFKLLNRSEANYLLKKNADDTEAPLIQAVFNDLVTRDFIVKTGFKYGANFRIYSGTIEEHADYLVHVLEQREQWYKISRAVRVAQGVRKEMIFSGMLSDRPAYVKLRRVRDPFGSEYY